MATLTKDDFLHRCNITPALFDELCRLHKIPAGIALGIIMTESGGNYGAMRFEKDYPYTVKTLEFADKMGWTVATEKTLQQFSYGLLQIMGATARSYGFSMHPVELLHANVNLSWGFHHLASLFQKYKNWPDTIAAYNFGHAAKKPFSTKYKNQDYVDKVTRHSKEFDLGGSGQSSNV